MRHKALLAVVAVLAVSGCTRDQWQRFPGPDDVMHAIPYLATMQRGLAVQPYKWPEPRLPVEGTVPVTGNEPDLGRTITNNPDQLRRINALRNPVQMTAQSIERGKDRFDIYCLPCHGSAADGNGPVPVGVKIPWVPSLLTAQAKGYTDGYLHTIMRLGRGLMPAYGDRLSDEDRWNVVNYLRTLQGAAQ